MTYKVLLNKKAINDLKNISYPIVLEIEKKIDTCIAISPLIKSKLLKGNGRKIYSYRCGIIYRIIYEINFESRVIIISRIWHRKDIYL